MRRRAPLALLALAVLLAGCRDGGGRHGVDMTFRVEAAPGEALGSGDVERAARIVRARLARSGRTGTVTADATAHRLVVHVDGGPLEPKERSLVFAYADLSFYDLEAAATGPSAVDQDGNVRATTNLFSLLAGQQARVRKAGDASAWYLFDRRKLPAGLPAPSRANLLTRHGGVLPKGFTVFGVPKNTVVITCGRDEVTCPGVTASPTRTSYYLFKHGSYPSDRHGPYPRITGADLNRSATKALVAVDTGGPEVELTFTRKGANRFQQMTREEYRRGRVFHNPQHFAIVLDAEIKSIPQIDYTDSMLADGIDPVDGVRITGLKNLQDAENVALALQDDVHFRLVPLTGRG